LHGFISNQFSKFAATIPVEKAFSFVENVSRKTNSRSDFKRRIDWSARNNFCRRGRNVFSVSTIIFFARQKSDGTIERSRLIRLFAFHRANPVLFCTVLF